MHDPSTVAFEIRYPWRRKPCKFWPKGYRDHFITIWHNDPLNFKGKLGCRDDDSCGWFRPPFTSEDRERIEGLAKTEYRNIFSKQVYTAEGKSFASAGYDPSVHDAIYWSWRSIKYHQREKGWRYGGGRNQLSADEIEYIYLLASNPVDNLRFSFSRVKDLDSFTEFFFIVYRCFSAFHRPWYKHPRWHFWHWSIQLHPWQNLKRRFWDRCCKCGKRGFKKNQSAIGNGSGTEIWHSTCDPRHQPVEAAGPKEAA